MYLYFECIFLFDIKPLYKRMLNHFQLERQEQTVKAGLIYLDVSFVNVTVTSQWAPWRFKAPASWLFTQPFVQAHIKENIKALGH